MSAQFFRKAIGYACNRPALVTADGAVIFITIEAGGAAATPEQAKELGRALIKAAKWAQKHSSGGDKK